MPAPPRHRGSYGSILPTAASDELMKTQIAFEPKEGYLRVVIHGRYPSATYPEILRSIHDEASKLGLARILVDGFSLSAPPSEMDRFSVGVSIAELFGRRYRIAILYPRELINKFAEDAAVNRGANLLVASEEGAALAWLLDEKK
jgi:hypothetical protein